MPAELRTLLRARYPLIWLDTPEETRAAGLICRIARGMADPVTGWSQTWGLHDVPGTPTPGNHPDPQKLLEHVRGQDRRCIWILKDLGPLLAHNPAMVRALKDTARICKDRGSVLVCLGNGHELPAELAGEAATHRLALPDRDEHDQQLRRVCRQLGVPLTEAAARALSTACLGLTLEQSENIWARVHANRGRFTEEDLPIVLAEKARIVRASGYLDFVTPVPMDTVGGLDALKRWVRQRKLGFSDAARQIGLPYPRGVLLVGVQGCGKSLTAKAVAGDWGQPLLRMDVGSLMDELVGSSERNLRQALDLAERVAPCVLWIDEIEKGFAGLGTDNDGGTVTRMFGSMLTWLQEKTTPVFVLATSNDISGLPPEMLRKGRFDEIFFVDLPDTTQREAIWRVHLGDRAEQARDPGLLGRTDPEALADLSDGYSGAEIAAAVVEGAFAALSENAPLASRHVMNALSASPPLSRTRAESIGALRDWADGRARPAS